MLLKLLSETFMKGNSGANLHPYGFTPSLPLFIPALSSGSALVSPCIFVSLLPNSLQTFTHSQLGELLLCCSLSLISLGSAPACLLLLLAAYFAPGLFPHVSSLLLCISPDPLHLFSGRCGHPMTPSFSPNINFLFSIPS